MGDTTNANFVNLNVTKITVNPAMEAGVSAIIGSENSGGTFRTMTFVNGGNGTYTITDLCDDNRLDIFDLCMMKQLLSNK
ncbi:MAG: hypothetical protein K2J37_07070 [Ruminococcus sp.]|nr:hypothetical protein [Ruminococcus sp.]MDE6785047.1 hypothetical protein [Ruminococcus sp.]